MTTLRFAYNTNGFLAHDLDSALEIVAEAGYRGVALTLDVHHLDPATATAARLRSLRRRLESLRLAAVVETGGRFVLDRRRKHRPTLLDAPRAAAARERFLASAIDVATGIGAGVVSFWSGAAPDGLSRKAGLERLAAACRRLARRAARAGVTIGFEPEPGMFVADLRGWRALAAAVGEEPAFALTLDVGHVHLTERSESIADVLRANAARLVNVHVEDMRRPRHEHLPFGEGEIGFPPVLRALHEIGYRGLVSVELSRSSHEAPDMARRAIAFLRRAALSARPRRPGTDRG